MKFRSSFHVLVVFVFLAAIPGICEAGESGEKFIFNEEVYREDLNSPRNMASFNRAIGIITDLVREQRRLFSEKRNSATNETADKAEEKMNEANLLGSQAQYDEAYALLFEAFDLLAGSIKELAAESGK